MSIACPYSKLPHSDAVLNLKLAKERQLQLDKEEEDLYLVALMIASAQERRQATAIESGRSSPSTVNSSTTPNGHSDSHNNSSDVSENRDKNATPGASPRASRSGGEPSFLHSIYPCLVSQTVRQTVTPLSYRTAQYFLPGDFLSLISAVTLTIQCIEGDEEGG